MPNKEKNFISAVVYVHNAQDSIGEFLQALISEFHQHFQQSEIICVNDFSTDESVTRIKSCNNPNENCSISILNLSYFHGLELAMNAGMSLAIGDFVYEFDKPYLDFNKEEILKLYKRSLQGYDIVNAVPQKKESWTSALFYKTFQRFSGLSQKMSTESFRILSRRVINRISAMNKTIPYRKVVYANAGLKADSLYYTVLSKHNRNLKKTNKLYRRELAIDSLLLFTELGYKFSSYLTLSMLLLSLFMAGYTIITYVTANPTEGWTTTLLFLSFAFLGLFTLLTIIIRYLKLLLDLVFKRKHFAFESIEKLSK